MQRIQIKELRIKELKLKELKLNFNQKELFTERYYKLTREQRRKNWRKLLKYGIYRRKFRAMQS